MSTSIGKLLMLSPHLDDAVFSCGCLLARNPGAVVVTIFAGAPPHFSELTEWDAGCGFHSAQEAVHVRKMEDAAALAELGAKPVWLDFFDSQYRASPAVDALAAALDELISSEHPDTLIVPAGLFHSDHELAHRAALALFPRHRSMHWLMYEDALYRRIPGRLQARLVELAQAGIEATPIELYFPPDQAQIDTKRRASQCYASQLRALATAHDGYADAFAPERCWRLGRPGRQEAAA